MVGFECESAENALKSDHERLIKAHNTEAKFVHNLIDQTVLKSAEQMLGKRELRAAIKSTFQVLSRDLSLVERFVDGDDIQQLANKIHQANGPCSIFGAVVLSEWLCELEDHLRCNYISLVPKKVEYIRTLTSMTERELILQTGDLLQRSWYLFFNR